MSACVTLEEVVAAAHARSASLVPETSGYLALAVSDATSRLPLRLDDRAVLLTTEGTVTVRTRGEAVAPAEAARLLRDLLARLLAASAGSMPNLTATARPRPAHEQDPEAVARELEAALIPVNRNAARRALARLARETLRAKEAGRLRRPRTEVQAKPAAPEAEELQPPPQAEHARRDATVAAPRSDAPAALRSDAPAAPLQHPIVELTLSPGPIAPAIVELTLSPGLVACATSGAALPAPATAGDGAVAVAVEPCPDVATAPAHAGQQAEAPERASHASEHVEALPEPTPTIVQAVVELDVAPAPAEIPIIPELVEPARSIAPVAPIARAAVEIAPEGARPVPAPSLVACGASACSEALTSPEGLEVLLVDFSPGPAAVALSSREPTPTASILVEFSPEPADVVPLSQEPTPTVATAVWEEREAAGEPVLSRVAEAPAGATDVPEPIETSRAPAIHFMAPDAALQVTPAYGAWPLVRRSDLAVPAGPRAAVAPFEETPAARHTLPWPVPTRCDDDAPAAPIPTALAAPVEALLTADADGPETAHAGTPAEDTPAAPVEALLTADADGPETAHAGTPAEDEAPEQSPADAALEQPPAVLASEELPADAAASEEPPAVLASEELPADATASEEPLAVLAPEELPADAALDQSPADLAPEQPPADLAREQPPADLAPEQPPADLAPEQPPADLAPEQPPADLVPTDAASAQSTADAEPEETPCPAELGPIDAIVWNASRRSRSARPPAEGVDAGASRVDELVARFVAQSEHSTQRRAARSMKALAGLDLTRTPPPVAAVSATSALAVAGARPPLAGAQRPVAPELAPPESAHVVPTDAGSRPPVPLVAPRRRGLSLWLALLALALLCAGLAGTLRPDVFASLTEPLARGAL